MARVHDFRIVSPGPSGRVAAGDFFESDIALLRTQRSNEPGMVRDINRPMRSDYPGTVSAKAALGNALNHFSIQPSLFGRVLKPKWADAAIWRQVESSPGELGVLLQYRRAIPDHNLPTERAPFRPFLRLNEVIPYSRARRIDHNPIMRKHF